MHRDDEAARSRLAAASGDLVRQTDVRVDAQGCVSRRDFLGWLPAAAFAAGSVSWTDLMAAESPALRRRGKACILLWMHGGPSQFETFSPLSRHANAGETKAISTSVPGIQIAEHLPRLALQMDDLCLIRSVTSKEGSHPRASFLLHTGYLPNPSVRHPSFGSNVAERLGVASAELPNFVRIGASGRDGSGGGLLGVAWDPFVMTDPRRAPENTEIRTDERRFARRLALTRRMNDQFARQGAKREAADQEKLYERASRMILSRDMDAFDLSREPQRVREAYGSSDFAAGCLLARRLVEAGVTFVEVGLGNWDTHQDNFSQCQNLCGELDQPFAQLLQDLKDRRLLDDTLVIWMGEFGRTPRINARAGRDHFPRAFNVALAGGGVQGGQVIGKVDPSGNEVTEQPVAVPDLFRTFCDALQIDAEHENFGPTGRPIKIVDGGEVIKGVLGT